MTNRAIKLADKVYPVDAIPPMYGKYLNGVIETRKMEAPDENGNDYMFALTALPKVALALEAVSEYIVPDLVDDGVVTLMKNGRNRFNGTEEECLLLFLQLLTIFLVDNIKKDDYTPDEWGHLETTKEALLQAMVDIGLKEFYPEAVVDNFISEAIEEIGIEEIGIEEIGNVLKAA